MCIQYAVQWDKTQILKKFPSDKINGYKKCLFFSFASSNSSVILLICGFYMSWSTSFVSVKMCVGLSIFDFVSPLLKFKFFVQQNAWTLTLKRHNSLQNENNWKATHSIASRPLIFKLQQVLKFNNICVSYSSPKTDLVTNFLDLENRNFENVSFSHW